MKKENARPHKAETSAVEQRKFTPAAQQQSRVANVFTAEYNGVAVTFTGDGWINGTQVVRRFNKRLDDWLRLAETTTYMCALAKALNTADVRDLLRAKRGRNGYTQLHPKLGVALARWCDVDFAVWCDLQIDHILRGGLSIWQKAGADHSDTTDREPLLTAAAAIVARHRLPFGPVYQALNLFAGVTNVRQMSCAQVMASASFGTRLLTGNATPGDFALIEHHRSELGGEPLQLSLLDAAGGALGGAL
jgi:hypothetical protein